MQLQKIALLLGCVGGIYVSYLTQGYVSEHLSMKKYGDQGERFAHLEALNGAQSLTCFIWAWLLLQVLPIGGTTPPWHIYWKTGLTNSIGPACGMFALKNISYPAQVLAKSCKMVPVMLVGSVLHSKSYSVLEYVYMLLVGIGLGLFAKKSSHKVSSKLVSPNAPLGYSLCIINLLFDGYTNAAQDEINKNHPKNSPIHMMCWMNFWTFFYYAIYMFLLPALLQAAGSTGLAHVGWDLVHFCQQHQDAAMDVFLFCFCGAVGQLFIFLTINRFGSLVNTLACTTRKFFSVLISVVLNNNSLLMPQWVGVTMVFVGLIGSTVSKAYKPGKQKQH